MNTWIPFPLTLTGETVDLISIDIIHLQELQAIAMDNRIWEFTLNDASTPEKFNKAYESAIIEREKGNEFPFVVVHKRTNRIVGSTRFLDLNPYHKTVEIGWTWYHPDYWATEVNVECKLLLLTYCFEILKTNRVQLITDQRNIRSQKAIEKIGGKFEGIIRNHLIRDNGSKRNSALYSIIDEEWDETKELLTRLYQKKNSINR
jgi:RimJ/RimL family protein N-acetyltransferase